MKYMLSFGAEGYQDYTTHKDKDRYLRYVSRHSKQEVWTKAGIKSAGFWAKWILWHRPSLQDSIKETNRMFNIDIKLIE